MKKRELLETLLVEGVIEKHDSGWYRTVTPAAIRDAVDWLLLANDVTTTLDVKNWLRDRGFWVVQQQVSDEMNNLAVAGVLSYLDNGTFRHYYYKYP